MCDEHQVHCALKMAQRDDFVWARPKRGSSLAVQPAACGQGSNASKDGDLSENPGSIPCTVPSTASAEAQNPWSRRRQRPGRPPTAQLYLELSFFCLLAQINPRNLASGWMCGRRVGLSHLHRRLSLSGVEAIKKIFTARIAVFAEPA